MIVQGNTLYYHHSLAASALYMTAFGKKKEAKNTFFEIDVMPSKVMCIYFIAFYACMQRRSVVSDDGQGGTTNAKPPFMSCQRSAFNEVNDWALYIYIYI